MKCSIRTKITLMVVSFACFVVIASWVVCNYVIEGVFVNHLKDSLTVTYHSCNELFRNSDYSNQDIDDLYGQIKNPADAMILILDLDNSKIYTSINDEGRMMESLYNIIKSISDTNEGVHLSKQGYVIKRNHDDLINADYYDLVGKLDNGCAIVIRTPISEVESATEIVSHVYNITAATLIVFGAIFVLVFSNIFSGPIKNLSNVAKRMTKLDFDVKATIYTKDEIGELGNSMNELSEKLESTISQLKMANITLCKDIENKQQIDDMRKEFLSHVSHELKTPIALIQGYAEGLKDSISDNPESMDFYADVIIDESKKMNMLVKKLLDLNEIEFGQVPINIERFDIVSFIRDIINSTKVLLDGEEKNIVFEEEGPVYVWADEYMIERAFTNYLTNAIHYVSDNGTIKVFFYGSGNDLRVCVYNQGELISPEDIDKLFIKFYKSDKARSREYGGNGIGLSIVAATMEAHGKNYGVYNVDDGVVFYFDLDVNMPC